MSLNLRPWLVWLFPFLVSGGMAIGALIGMNSVSDTVTQEGPSGDIAGAAGALMVVICLVAGFAMATLTVIATKVLNRRAPNRIGLRFGLSIVGGGIIGVIGIDAGYMSTVVVWFLLLGLPVLLSWSWHVKEVSDG